MRTVSPRLEAPPKKLRITGVDGHVLLAPDFGPRLGVALDRDRLARCTPDPRPPSRCLDMMRPSLPRSISAPLARRRMADRPRLVQDGAMSDDVSPRGALLERAEHYIYLATALILVLAAAALLISAVVDVVRDVIAGDIPGALLHLLDRALLVLMLAEIIYTVRSIARRRQLEVEPFFIVAIIAAIRRILIITAESTENVNLQDPHFQAAMLELGLLALIVLALAGAMRIIPGGHPGFPEER